MGEDIELERGIIDAMSRVLTELIDTPLVKSIVRLTVNDIDPKSASKLLKALVWGDIEFLVNILGFIPPLVNTVAEILNDLPDELQHFSPKMIDGLVSQVIGDIEIKRLAEGVNGLVQYLSSLIEDDPKFVSDLISNLLSDLLSAIDDKVLGKMMGNLLGVVILMIPELIGILLTDLSGLLSGLLKSMKIGDLLSGLFKSVGIGGLLR